MTENKEWGSARLRVLGLPNGQFMLVMDRAGLVMDNPDRMEEWLTLRNLTLSRLGPECVGFFRFAGDCEIPSLDVAETSLTAVLSMKEK